MSTLLSRFARRRGALIGTVSLSVVAISASACPAAPAPAPAPARVAQQPVIARASRLVLPMGERTAGFIGAASEVAAVAAYTQAGGTVVDAFARDGGRLASTPAELDPGASARVAGIAATDTSIVVADGAGGDTAPPTGLVFARPSPGWTGTIEPSATLLGGGLGSGATSGPEVAAYRGLAVLGNKREVDVFAEPVSGWEGTVTPTARLHVRGSGPVVDVAVSPEIVAAATRDSLCLYTPQRDGWRGVSQPTTCIRSQRAPLEAVAATSDDVLAAGDASESRGTLIIVHRSPGGWSRPPTVKTLAFRGYDSLVPEVSLTASNRYAVLQDTNLYTGDHECPCDSSLYGIALTGPQPRLLTASSQLSTDGYGSALSNRTLITAADEGPGGLDSLWLYDVSTRRRRPRPASRTAATS